MLQTRQLTEEFIGGLQFELVLTIGEGSTGSRQAGMVLEQQLTVS